MIRERHAFAYPVTQERDPPYATYTLVTRAEISQTIS